MLFLQTACEISDEPSEQLLDVMCCGPSFRQLRQLSLSDGCMIFHLIDTMTIPAWGCRLYDTVDMSI